MCAEGHDSAGLTVGRICKIASNQNDRDKHHGKCFSLVTEESNHCRAIRSKRKLWGHRWRGGPEGHNIMIMNPPNTSKTPALDTRLGKERRSGAARQKPSSATRLHSAFLTMDAAVARFASDLCNSIIRAVGGLHALVATDPHSNVSCLDHSDVVGTIPNGERYGIDVFLDHVYYFRLLERRHSEKERKRCQFLTRHVPVPEGQLSSTFSRNQGAVAGKFLYSTTKLQNLCQTISERESFKNSSTSICSFYAKKTKQTKDLKASTSSRSPTRRFGTHRCVTCRREFPFQPPRFTE